MYSGLYDCIWFASIRPTADNWVSVDLDSHSLGPDIGKRDDEVVDMLDIALGRLKQLDTGTVGAIQYSKHQTHFGHC